MKTHALDKPGEETPNHQSNLFVIATFLLLAFAGSLVIAGASAEEAGTVVLDAVKVDYGEGYQSISDDVFEPAGELPQGLTASLTPNLPPTANATCEPTEAPTPKPESTGNATPSNSNVSGPIVTENITPPQEPLSNETSISTNSSSFEIEVNPVLEVAYGAPEDLVLSPLPDQIVMLGIENYPVTSPDGAMSIEAIFASGFEGKFLVGYSERDGLYYICECDPALKSLVAYRCFGELGNFERALIHLKSGCGYSNSIYILSASDLSEDSAATSNPSDATSTMCSSILELPETNVDYILPEQVMLSLLDSSEFVSPNNWDFEIDGMPVKKNIPHASVNSYLSNFYTSYSGEVGMLDYATDRFDTVNLSAPYDSDIFGYYWNVNDYMGSFTSGSQQYLVFGSTGGGWSSTCNQYLQVVAVAFDFPNLSDVHVFYIDSSEEKDAGQSITFGSSVFEDEIIAYKGGVSSKYYRLKLDTIKNAVNGNKFVEIPAYKECPPGFPALSTVNKLTDDIFYQYSYNTYSPDSLLIINLLTDEWESFSGYWDNYYLWPGSEIKRSQKGNDIYVLTGNSYGLQCFKYNLSALDFDLSTSEVPISRYWSYTAGKYNQVFFDSAENAAYVFGYSSSSSLTKVSKIQINADLTGYQVLFEEIPKLPDSAVNQYTWFSKAAYPEMTNAAVVCGNTLFDEPTSRLIPLRSVNFTEFLLPLDSELSDYISEYYYGSAEIFERTSNGFLATVSYYNWSTHRLKSYVVEGDINPLIANFTASPMYGVAPLSVQFSDLSIDTETRDLPESRLWDFGDGETKTEINPLHTYDKPGTYPVTLTVTNGVYSATKKKLDLVIALNASPTIDWDTVVGGGQRDEATAVIQTPDGEYVVAGYTESWSNIAFGYHDNGDAHIVKLKRDGTVRWQKCLGGSYQDCANAVLQTTDGGYIVAGSTSSNDGDVFGNHGGSDFWVVKLKSDGTIDWRKCFGGSGQDCANAVLQTADGGYLVAGYTSSNDEDVSDNQGQEDFWIVKLVDDGTMTWSQCFGGSRNDRATALAHTSDGGFIVAGYTESSDGDVSGNRGCSDFWIVKLKPDGSMDWQKCLGGSGYEYADAVTQVSTGGYAVAGRTTSCDGDVLGNDACYDYDSWIVKMSDKNEIDWQKCLGGSSYDSASSVVETDGGGFLVAGETESSDRLVFGSHGQKDFRAVKLFRDGAIDWQRCLGGTNSDIASAVIQTSDGGVVIAGSTMSSDGDVTGDSGNQWNMWIVKLRGDQQLSSSSGHQLLIEKATAWAEGKEGSTGYTTSSITYGLAFVRDAYQVGAEARWSKEFEEYYYGLPLDDRNAKSVYNYLLSLGKIGTGAPPKGALVFYDCTLEGWEKYGHVALSLEDDGSRVIHVQPAPQYVVIDNGYDLKNLLDKPSERYSSYEYLGWAYPPVESPIPYSPVGGVSMDINTPVFKWNQSEWSGLPDPEYYALYISEYPYGEENLVFNSRSYGNGKITGESFEIPDDLPEDQQLQPDAQYRWNVQAFYSDGTSGHPAAKGYFTTGIVEENEPPVASFTTSPLQPMTYESVIFDASESFDQDGKITSFTWEVTDEYSHTLFGQKSSFSFSSPGDYSVTLTVEDDKGEKSSLSKEVEVIENNNNALRVSIDGPNKMSRLETSKFTITITNPTDQDSGMLFVQLLLDPCLNIKGQSSTANHYYYDKNDDRGRQPKVAIWILEDISAHDSEEITFWACFDFDILDFDMDQLKPETIENKVIVNRQALLSNTFYPGIGWTPEAKDTKDTARRYSQALDLDAELMKSYYETNDGEAKIEWSTISVPFDLRGAVHVWLASQDIYTNENYVTNEIGDGYHPVIFSHSGGTQTLYKKLEHGNVTADCAVFIAPALLEPDNLSKLIDQGKVQKIIIMQSPDDILYNLRLVYDRDYGDVPHPAITLLNPSGIPPLNAEDWLEIWHISQYTYTLSEEAFWVGGASREYPELFEPGSTIGSTDGSIYNYTPSTPSYIRKLSTKSSILNIGAYNQMHGYLLDWTIEKYQNGEYPFDGSIHPSLRKHDQALSQADQIIYVSCAHDPNVKYGPERHVPQDQCLNYTIEYENEGDGTAFGVYFTDTLDQALDTSTLVIGPVYSTSTGSQIADAGIYNATTRTINWTVGEVPPGEGGYANISIKWLESVPDETVATNYATVYFPSAFEKTQTNTIITKKGVNYPPSKPEAISPVDGVDNLELSDVLSWTCNDSNEDSLQYDIYLGTSNSPPIAYNGSYSTEYVYNLSNYDTTYYWKVVARDFDGAIGESDVYHFTTRPEHPLPVVGFVSNTQSGAAPLTVRFFDTSYYLDNTSDWNWAFGDGGNSSEQNPIHTYNDEGIYNVTLEVSNEWGNTSSTRVFYIKVTSSAVDANFTANVTLGAAPLTVQFNDTSTGNPTLWNWTVGDGNTSTDQNPTHTYISPGNYSVALTVSNGNANDTVAKEHYIQVQQPLPRTELIFNVNYNRGTANDTIASGTVPFRLGYLTGVYNPPDNRESILGNLSFVLDAPEIISTEPAAEIDGIRMTWTFPPSTAINPGMTLSTAATTSIFAPRTSGVTLERSCNRTTFTEAGVQQVTLNMTFDTADLDGLWGRIECTETDDVRPAIVPGTISTDLPLRGISEENTRIQFTINRSAIETGRQYTLSCAVEVDPLRPVAYVPACAVWEVRNSTSAVAPVGTAVALPAEFLPENVSNVTFSSATPCEWLCTHNEHVITSLHQRAILTSTPTANFTANVTAGPAPLTVQFTDTSTGSPTAWSWSFGDGNTSTQQHPVHTYLEEGLYTVNLTVSTSGGSDTVTVENAIAALRYGDVNLDGRANLIDALTILHHVVGNLNVTEPLALMQGDLHLNDRLDVGDAQIIMHYDIALDTLNPRVSGIDSGSVDLTIVPGTATVHSGERMPINITLLDAENVGSYDLVVTWNPAVLELVPQNNITLQAGGVWNATVGEVHLAGVLSEPANGNLTLCTLNVTAVGSPGSSSLVTIPTREYSILKAYSCNSVPFTVSTTTVIVSEPAPVANFTANATAGIAPLAVQFTDTSTGDPTTWLWTLGDGSTSLEQHPTHTYTTPGNYTVTLTVGNANGNDTLSRAGYIRVSPRQDVLWDVPLSITSGTFGQTMTLGSAESATRGFDAGLDVPMPPDAPAAKKSIYFFCMDPTFGQLSADYKPPVDDANPEESWTLSIRSDEPVQVTWDTTLLAGSNLFLTWDNGTNVVDMKATGGTTLPAGSYSITISASTVQQMDLPLQAGWNLVSVPFSDAGYTDPQNSILAIYGYNTSTKGYETISRIESLVPGKAYWIASGRDCTVVVTGAPASPVTAQLRQGWNLIGSTAGQSAFSSITITPAGAWAMPFVYGYDLQTKGYAQITELQLGEGYWGAVTQDCTITLP